MKLEKIGAVLFLVLLFSGCRMEMAADDMSGIFPSQSQGQRADTVKEELYKIKGITGSAVVVEGYTAIIGLRTEDMDKKQTKAIIKQAEQAVKEAQADIKTVSVTTNESIVALIEKEEKNRSGL